MFISRRLTPCFESIPYLRKSYLRGTAGQTRLSSIATINIERSYANNILQESLFLFVLIILLYFVKKIVSIALLVS